MAVSVASPRTIALGIILFLASALTTYTVRSSRHSTGLIDTGWLGSKNPFASASIDAAAAAAAAVADKNAHVLQPKVAYATFLAGKPHPKDVQQGDDDDEDGKEEEDYNTDGYFLSARVLIYQLLHSPTAGTNSSIPFLVLVTEDVTPRKRIRLAQDGAIIVPVSKLEADWVVPGDARWADVLTKLRLWEQVAYDKICFIDADMLVTKPLDGVFDDPATRTATTLANPAAVLADEAALPSTYTFATHADFWGFDHPYPPLSAGEGEDAETNAETNADADASASASAPSYLNCGFFVIKPDVNMFAYYLSLLALPGRFDPALPEQNLLNHAHRRDGNMPWRPLWYGWNVNWPGRRDWLGGAASFHAKYWDDDPAHDPILKALWREQRAEMEGFYRGRDGALLRLL